MEYTTINEMMGKVFTDVSKVTDDSGDDELVFTCDDGRKFVFYHYQDCCEHVSIDDITGDLTDLVGVPILQAEEASKDGNDDNDNSSYESCTWTFYKFATIKGYVTVRWFGSSNGYYSESVSYEWRD